MTESLGLRLLAAENGERRDERVDVAVVGAGVAGLAVTRCLLDRGVDVLALDENPDIAHSWRNRYDSLRLNSVRWFSQMPGLPMPKRYGRWVSRDDLVEYVTEYAAPVRRVLRNGCPVTRIERGGADCRWLLTVPGGLLGAHHVVLTTGLYHEPKFPCWPGRAAFAGTLLHAADYQRPEPFDDQDVVIVGAGVSGVDIAGDLLRGRCRTLSVAVRTAPGFLPRELYGVPLQPLSVANKHLPIKLQDMGATIIQRLSAGDLSKTPLGRPSEGMFSRLLRTGISPSVDDGEFLAGVRAGRVQILPAVADLDERGILTADGAHHPADAVIAATGYRTGLKSVLTEPGFLNDEGIPAQYGPATRQWRESGMHVIGFTSPLTGHLREIGLLAKKVAKDISKQPSPVR